MSGGWYCSGCGALYRTLGSGRIDCQRCGKLGLRGYARVPRQVTCPEHPEWRGWDDGGVNDDMPGHIRRHHAELRSVPTTGGDERKPSLSDCLKANGVPREQWSTVSAAVAVWMRAWFHDVLDDEPDPDGAA